MAWKWPNKLRVLMGPGLSAWALGFSIAGAACVLAGPTSAAAEKRASTAGPRLIHYKGRNFRIPITLPTEAEARGRIKEVTLLYSEDSGYKWQPVSKMFPDRPHPAFSFRATHDGEYWFAVQISTADGRVSPALDSTVEPSLKVIVDTQPPELVLEPEERRGSTAAVRWEVKDRYLDPSALVLEYQVEGVGTWRQLRLPRPTQLIGSRRWEAGTAEAIKVRMTAVDLAGNATTETLELPEGTAERPVAEADEPRDLVPPPVVEPISSVRPPRINPGQDFTPVNEDLDGRGDRRRDLSRSRPGSRPRPRSDQPPWDRGPGARSPERPASATEALDNSDHAARGTRAGRDARPFSVAGAARGASSTGLPSSSPSPSMDGFVAMAGPRDRDRDPDSTDGLEHDNARAIDDAGAPRVSNPPDRSGTGARPGTLLVKSPRFPLQYAVDDAGANGPASVELWITQDGGRTWIRRGEDPDRASPIEVDLGGEGTYGLCLVARSASGLGDRPPAPGDPPQTWVEVDVAAPSVQLDPIRIGTGANTGKIAIDWRATDLHLPPRSVSLFWRPDQPGAAWQPLAEQQENAGQYVWTVPPSVPARFHVRAEAVDAVGHRGVAESTDYGPIIVDRSRPHGRIIGLDPNARAGADRPMR